jgi:protein-S-isoprenylcysteine O-methyltransferase Ste14
MMRTIGQFLFRYRNALFPMMIPLFFLPGPQLSADRISVACIGAALALLGQAMRAFTIGLRYIVRGGRGGRAYADDLVTDGVYSLCRNPMYVGNLLIIAGLSVAANSWTSVLLMPTLALFFYAAIVAAEEAYLRDKFRNAYDAYCRDVPRWLPRLARLGEALSSSRFHWRRVIVREYGTPLGWIVILAIIVLVNLNRHESHAHEVQVIVISTVLVAAVLWTIAWALKKSRLMVAD